MSDSAAHGGPDGAVDMGTDTVCSGVPKTTIVFHASLEGPELSEVVVLTVVVYDVRSISAPPRPFSLPRPGWGCVSMANPQASKDMASQGSGPA